MNANLVALLVTTVGAICLGIAVYQRTPDRVWNRLFGIHATLAGLWTFVIYLVMASDTPGDAGLFLRLTHPFGALAICLVLDFAWVFPERIDYAARRKRAVLYGLGMLVATVAFAPNLYHSLQLQSGIVNVQYGWPLIPFGLFSLGTLIYADVILLRKAFRLEGVQRVQVLWVLIGLAGTHVWGLLTIIVIPLLGGGTAWSGWGPVGLISTQIGMGYAIAKHNLMRPGVAVRRLAIAVVSALVVVTLGLGGLKAVAPLLRQGGVPLPLAYMIVGLVMGTVVVLVHSYASRTLGRPGTAGDPETVHAETSSQILRTLDREQLLDLLARALDDALEPTRVAVYTRSRTGGELIPRVVRHEARPGAGNGEAPIDVRHSVLEFVAREGSLLSLDQVFRFASMSEARRLSTAMGELHVQMVAPMIWEDELIGAVMVGPKRSGEMYENHELRFVADMALQSSLALRNADLYAETAALKDFNERILTQMDNAVVVTDDEERIVVFNTAAERLFDIGASQARGSAIDVLPVGIANCIRASLGSGRILSSRHFEIMRGGEAIPLACSTSPLEGDREGRRQGAVAVISDLTLIQELDRERREAERLTLIRVISAGMAHEIRNPLVAIRTFAELAPRRLDDPEFRSNFLTVVQEEILRIDKLVGDLLTLSKPADAVVEEVEIDLICQGVLRAVAGMAETGSIELRGQLAELPGVVMGDETRLHQALLNLLSNAIDAEPEGGRVTLRTESLQDADGVETVRMSVHNSGSYIPPDMTEEIFRPFVSKKATGTGLGLAICQTIIEEHRGHISVESTREGGTTFVVDLPLAHSRVAAHAGGPE